MVLIARTDGVSETGREPCRAQFHAGMLGGLAAGMIVSGVMTFGRDLGLLQHSLADAAEDWLDDRFDARARKARSTGPCRRSRRGRCSARGSTR